MVKKNDIGQSATKFLYYNNYRKRLNDHPQVNKITSGVRRNRYAWVKIPSMEAKNRLTTKDMVYAHKKL